MFRRQGAPSRPAEGVTCGCPPWRTWRRPYSLRSTAAASSGRTPHRRAGGRMRFMTPRSGLARASLTRAWLPIGSALLQTVVLETGQHEPAEPWQLLAFQLVGIATGLSFVLAALGAGGGARSVHRRVRRPGVPSR